MPHAEGTEPNFFEALAHIADEYPAFWPLFNKPGMAAVLLTAVKEDWPVWRLEAAIQATPYWQSTTESQRSWDVLVARDPGEANKRRLDALTIIDSEISKLGATLTPLERFELAVYAIRDEWTDEQIRNTIVVKYLTPDRGLISGAAAGTLGQKMSEVQRLANDFGVHMSAQTAYDWARRLTIGLESEESMYASMTNTAKMLNGRNADLVGALDRGFTVRQYMDPYIQLAADELEINPDTISITDPKWFAPLNVTSEGSDERRSMTMSEWQAHIRQDQSYGYDGTTGAKLEATRLATEIAKSFGAI